MELTYGGPATVPAPYTSESLYVDQSYVNAYTVMATLNVMGKAAPLMLFTQNTTHGILPKYLKLGSQATFARMVEQFGNQNDSSVWRYDCKKGAGKTKGTKVPYATQNYVRAQFQLKTDNKCDIKKYTDILAPITVSNLIGSYNGHPLFFDPMRTEATSSATTYEGENVYYTHYVNSLWTYLKTNAIYVKTTFAIGNTSGKGLADCIVKGAVASTGAHAGKLAFTRFSGSCPTSKGASGSNTVTPADPLVIAKIKPCDFLLAAGSSTCNSIFHAPPPTTVYVQTGLYGTNGSYRSAVGEVLASFQAAGLLPLCPKSGSYPTYINFTAGHPLMDRATAQAMIQNQMAYTNPKCLTISGRARPLWNVYAAILSKYDNVYNYSYGDFLGLDGTVTITPPSGAAPWFDKLGKVAQPITITIVH
ncbi:MAG: hypothetical protein ACRES9_11075 [Gammaproteobacteria bacterium]